MKIDANGMHFQLLNEQIKAADGDITVDNCCGQRYIGAGLSGRRITVNGTPGNALGAYLDGAEIIVNGNGQDAVGDTMNDGIITIHGNAGDALGYAMRGGKIYVRGSSGYRTGIHMKQYKEKKPVVIIGESVGSFLGEYLAGGIIAVLNLEDKASFIGNFTGTGMHGGKMFIRTAHEPSNLPAQVMSEPATDEDMSELAPYLKEYCDAFSLNYNELVNQAYYVLKPNAKNPYKKLYTNN